MNILYITTLLPKSFLTKVLNNGKTPYVAAAQKFHRNLVKGFIAGGHHVKVLSYLPEDLEFVSEYKEDGINYSFSKYKNKAGIKHIQIAKNIIKKIRKEDKIGNRPDAIICDVLNVSLSIGSIFAGRSNHIKTVGIVTDLLGISEHEERGAVQRVASKFFKKYMSMFDRYVLLTQQMNEVVNPHKRPYIVMEGLCDGRKLEPQPTKGVRRLFYAGGRPSKDGIDILIQAFKRINDGDLQLNIYGSVPNVEIGPDPEDSRIIYHGVVSNDEIVKEELSSYLLINPRPTGEEYTKYSFPSKVMEYMATGVPMVTTKLAGIPEEYYNYVFTFDKCDVDAYYQTLKEILSLPECELIRKGTEAQTFVLENKNNKTQTERIIELINHKK